MSAAAGREGLSEVAGSWVWRGARAERAVSGVPAVPRLAWWDVGDGRARLWAWWCAGECRVRGLVRWVAGECCVQWRACGRFVGGRGVGGARYPRAVGRFNERRRPRRPARRSQAANCRRILGGDGAVRREGSWVPAGAGDGVVGAVGRQLGVGGAVRFAVGCANVAPAVLSQLWAAAAPR